MINKVWVIFWKDLLMRRNHYIATTLEVLLPVGLIILTNLLLPKNPYEINNDLTVFRKYNIDKCVFSSSFYERIVYEPSTPFTDSLMSKAACFAGYKQSAVKPKKLNDNSSYFSIGVKFHEINPNETLPEFLNYTLYPTDKTWVEMLTLWRHPGSVVPKYTTTSLFKVVNFQRAIDASFMSLKNVTAKELNLKNMDLFPRNPRIFSEALILAFFLAFFLMIPPIVSRIVQEKFTGAKELMLMMGVERWQLWVAKFMDAALFICLSVIGMIIFLYVPLKETSVTLKISPWVVFGIILYGEAGIILFLFFLSCFFERATLALFVTEAIWCLSFVFTYVIAKLFELPIFVFYLISVFPHLSLMNAITILLDFDFYDKPIKLSEKLSANENTLSLGFILLIMSFNIFFYMFLTWYTEQVKPGKFGVPLPYNFFFKKSYWSPAQVNAGYDGDCMKDKPADSFEAAPPNLDVGVAIQSVSKVYKSLDKGSITAVNNVNIDFYRNEISALLGHNGAGKTTMFSMITGLTYPTSGRILINGYDLGVNINEARHSLGLCPQHDMLFNDLTTVQTLCFYGVLKGLTLIEAKEETMVLIKKLKLVDVKNTPASKLSGGQKRKVSLAIALIGGSEVLVLDEPTSGMDPEIRREIWEILLGFRRTRTILLTTHFMEEADALCDRIAIMDHGKLKCYGTPMFLKSKFGSGYILSVVIADISKATELTDYIRRFVSSVNLKSQNVRTLNYELAESEVEAFPDLFTGLDEKQANNEIASYGISLATLEDVFLRLRSGREIMENEDSTDSPLYQKLYMGENSNDSRVLGFYLYLYQFWALMLKKCYLFRRRYKSFLMYSIVPAFIVILMFSLSNKNQPPHQIQDLSSKRTIIYSPSLYSSFLVYYSDHSKIGNLSSEFGDFVRNLGGTVENVSNVDKAVYDIFQKDFFTYANTLKLAVDFMPEEMNISFNDDAVHMIPIALNLFHNFLLKSNNKNSRIATSLNVSYSDKELYVPPPPIFLQCSLDNIPDFSGTQTLFYLLGPIKESFLGAKEIQLMITPTVVYWLSHLLFDVVSFVAYMIVVCLGVGFSQSDDSMKQHADEVALSLILWGAGLILLAYLISTLIKNIAAAFTVNLIIYSIFTFVMFNVINFGFISKNYQYLHPTCILKFGYKDLCTGRKSNYILALFLYDVVLFTLVLLKDSQVLGEIFHWLSNKIIKVDYSLLNEKDEFVTAEEDAVKSQITSGNKSPALIVNELKRWYWKNFKASPAVKGISFAVNEGECFGLLGVNGAGKTSTFRMLVGSLPISYGTAFVSSTKLSFCNRQKYLFAIGYCPQYGGLLPELKGKEILRFFAQLRGIRMPQAKDEVHDWLEKLGLLEFRDEKCGTYSGGNQRKLSTAISLIGECPLVFLDEPTSGVDPVSRRLIWNVIGDIQKKGRSIVLTSHSMDECEALCSRLAIMVNGRFRCIGEITTLKDRFGRGYCVFLKITNGASEESIYELKNAAVTSFQPGCELVDEHLTILQYRITNKSISWADLFKKLKLLKENFDILESYTASATTLEQIFIYFARNQ